MRRVDQSPWIRKHDDPVDGPRVERPVQHFFPDRLQDLVDIVTSSLGDAQSTVRASGSHWALSDAARTDSFVVETRGFAEPDGTPEPPALNRTLTTVIPQALSDARLRELIEQPEIPLNTTAPDLATFNYTHVECGTRIFELYSRLDGGEVPTAAHDLTRDVASLRGPWAMPTLGGAGGQTIVGAFSTGTMGGDQHQRPIADAVVAVHLVGCDGLEYWIEGTAAPGQVEALTDDERLHAALGDHVHIIRDDTVLNAVRVGCGRLGIIYSVVLRIVRQYGLHQARVTAKWAATSRRLLDSADTGLRAPRFLQVVVNPHGDGAGDHDCYIDTREAVGLAGMASWSGPTERGGPRAGKSAALGTPWFFTFVCSTLPYPVLVGIVLGLFVVAVAAAVLLVQYWLAAGLAVLGFIVASLMLRYESLGALLIGAADWLAGRGEVNGIAALNTFVLSSQQGPIDRTDISYAIQDIQSYVRDQCTPPGDSICVHFDAEEGSYVGYVNALFAHLDELHAGRLVLPDGTVLGHRGSFVGYFALRFTGPTQALIGMQRWIRTVNIEIASARKLRGAEAFLRVAETDAVRAGATVHWGQSNELTMLQVEAVFPAIDTWREVLSRFAQNGRLQNFATDFSRSHGLEIVTPRIGTFRASWLYVCEDEPVRFEYDALENPPGTVLRLTMQDASGAAREVALADLSGHVNLAVHQGVNRCELVAAFEFGGRRREISQAIVVNAYAPHDLVHIEGTARCLAVDGGSHWGVEASFDPAEWSPSMLASNLSLTSAYRGAILVRHPPAPDLILTTIRSGVALLGSTPLAGSWLMSVQEEGCTGEAPTLSLTVAVRCGSHP